MAAEEVPATPGLAPTPPLNQVLLAAKGVGILLVVIGHSLPGRGPADNPPFFLLLKNTIYLFHMPFFFFLSGWLYAAYSLTNTSKHQSAAHFFLQKFKRLMVPYFTLGTLGFLLKGTTAALSYRPYEFSTSFLLHGFLNPTEGAVQMYWFLSTLFCLFLFHPLLRIILKQGHRTAQAVALLALMCLHLLSPMDIAIGNLSSIAHYFVYFFLGCLAGPWLAKKTPLAGSTALLTLSTLFIITITAILSRADNQFMCMTTALTGIGATLALCSLLARSLPSVLAEVANFSFQIYLLSWFVQNPIRLLYQVGILTYIPTFALMGIAGIFLPIYIYRLLHNRFPTLTHLTGLD